MAKFLITSALRHHHEALAFRKAAKEVRTLWRLGNTYFASQTPWAVLKSDPECAVIVRTALNLVHAAALAAWPFIPTTAATVLESLGESSQTCRGQMMARQH